MRSREERITNLEKAISRTEKLLTSYREQLSRLKAGKSGIRCCASLDSIDFNLLMEAQKNEN